MRIAKSNLKNHFFYPVANTPLIVFRILFGLLICIECIQVISSGWVRDHFIAPQFTLTFIGFEWLQPLSGNGMYYIYILMAICAFLIAIGFFYRFVVFLFLILWTSCYLMQKTEYNNHYYLIILLSILMLIVPVSENLSFDCWRKKTYTETCPKWCILIFKFQISIVYIFAGINKLSSDWLQGHSMSVVLSNTDLSFIKDYISSSILLNVLTFGGVLFDLLIIPSLLYHRTRKIGFIALLFFHLFNSFFFQIGIFPYMMIALSVFFLPVDKIKLPFFNNRKDMRLTLNTGTLQYNKLILGIIIAYSLIQIFLPMRHLFYQGNTDWTEEGHRLSWRMMLRMKYGEIYYKAKDVNNNTWTIRPRDYLTEVQCEALAYQPDLIWQFAQYLSNEIKKKKNINTEIYAYSYVSLNGRPPQLFIDTTANLAKVRFCFFARSNWILPMKNLSSNESLK